MQHYQLRGFEVSSQGYSKGSGLAQVFQLKKHPDLKGVQYHPGGGIHGSSPYYKFTMQNKKEIRMVVDPDNFNPLTVSPKQHYFDSNGNPLSF
jgi:filamentous hemagglutinin